MRQIFNYKEINSGKIEISEFDLVCHWQHALDIRLRVDGHNYLFGLLFIPYNY